MQSNHLGGDSCNLGKDIMGLNQGYVEEATTTKRRHLRDILGEEHLAL